ncbi:MAG: flagellar basal body P-ring formation chaperone FlgA [Colwellia sp.]
MKYLLLLTLFLLSHLPANAVEWDKQTLEKSALDYIKSITKEPDNARLSFNISPIDPRIEIKACESKLRFKMRDKKNSKKKHIEVFCADKKQWKMYLSATIEEQFAVVSPTNSIAKGTLITEDDLNVIYLPEHKVRGLKFQNIEQLIGSKSKRRLSKGKPINQTDICMVCKGDAVTIIAQAGGLQIKTKGIAKSSGNILQQISVENKRSGKIITAQVKSLNKVVINL